MRDMTEAELAWVAGLLEGEGCFHLHWRRTRSDGSAYPSIDVRCNMTDEDVIRRLHTTIGAGRVALVANKGLRKNGDPCKPQWLWTLGRRAGAEQLMEQLRPLMGRRRAATITQALEALTAHPLRTPKAHGTTYAYDRGCRCAECRSALALKQRRYRAKRAVQRPRRQLRHGTRNAYERRGCRCDECVTFFRAQAKRRSQKRRDRLRVA